MLKYHNAWKRYCEMTGDISYQVFESLILRPWSTSNREMELDKLYSNFLIAEARKKNFEMWKKQNPPAPLLNQPIVIASENSIVDDVIDFHEKMGLKEISAELYEQKLSHLHEELSEIDNAIHDVEILDGAIDLIYVALGLLYAVGLIDSFEEGWKRVHKANMAKEPFPDSNKFVIKPEGWTPPYLGDLV